MLKKMFKKFVNLNKKISKKLETLFPTFFGEPRNCYIDQLEYINGIINKNAVSKILEVGGVDRPILKRSSLYNYYGMDIDDRPTCYDCYDKFLVQSVEDEFSEKFDLVISMTLLEHVPNNTKAMKAIYAALNAGGTMVHYVPSKHHFYSIILRILGHRMQKFLIKHLRPEAAEVTGYPAFFDRCSPREMSELCKETGFKEIHIVCYYKATDYFAFFTPLYILVSIFENLFQRLKFSYFSCGFIIIAEK